MNVIYRLSRMCAPYRNQPKGTELRLAILDWCIKARRKALVDLCLPAACFPPIYSQLADLNCMCCTLPTGMTFGYRVADWNLFKTGLHSRMFVRDDIV